MARVEDQDVWIAVLIVIAHRAAAADLFECESRSGGGRNFDEMTPIIAKEQVALPIAARLVDQFDVVENVTIGDKEVEVAIQIGVEELGAETEEG